LQICSDDDNEDFLKMIFGGAMMGQIYVDMFLTKNPHRTSTTSEMRFMLELFNTPRECHRQLRMSTEIFFDLHGLLVERYGLKPSLHMSTFESLGILLFICSGNESNSESQNRFKYSGETISRKFEEVLFSLMGMAKDFIRPKIQIFM
jgi:hypothetical protein